MYTEYFGLEKAIFNGGIAQNDGLFLGPRQQRVAANLKVGLTTRDAVVVLTGPLGVGKTTIASEALKITTTRLAQTWIGNTPLEPDEMLELLLAGFELAPFDMGRVQRIHTWRQFMGEMSVTDTPICILVENALALGVEGLQALESLTAADPNDCPGATLVLMGPPDLDQLLERPGLEPLKQRIRSRQRLDAMTPEEVDQYLRQRVAAAGGDYDKLFVPGTAAMVHYFSAGIPRMINNVCETALTVAATRKLTQIDPNLVQRVAEGVYGLAPNGELPEIPVAPEPVAAPTVAHDQPTVEPAPPADPPPPADPASPADPAHAAAPVADPEQPTVEPVPADEVPAPEAAPATDAEMPAEEPISIDEAPEPVSAPVASEEQPMAEPAASRDPVAEPVAAPAEPAGPPAAAEEQSAQGPVAAPVASMEQPSAAPAPSTEPAPIDAIEPPAELEQTRLDLEALVEPTELPIEPEGAPAVHANTEAQDAPAVSGTNDPVPQPPQPPILTQTFVEEALADLQDGPVPASATASVESPSEPPVLTDQVDVDLPMEIKDMEAEAQTPQATLPPDAPALPETELEPDEEFSEDFAAATHLHEISEEMAEMLFSADPETSATGVFEAAVPLEGDEIEAAVERTAVVEQLTEDDAPEPEENQPAAANTLVF